MGQIIIKLLIGQLIQRYGRDKPEQKLIISGLTQILAAIFFYFFFFNFITDLLLRNQMQFKENGYLFKIWKSIPVTVNVWAFQIENESKYLKNLELPRLTEIGPFVFRGHRNRIILEWSEQKNLIKFNESIKLRFDSSKSIGPLSIRIKTFNNFISINNQSINLSNQTEQIVENIELFKKLSIEELLQLKPSSSLENDDNQSSISSSIFYQTIEPNEMVINLRQKSHTERFNHFRFDRFPVENYSDYGIVSSLSCSNSLQESEGTFFGLYTLNEIEKFILNPNFYCKPMRFVFESDSKFDLIQTQRFEMDTQQFSLYEKSNWCHCPEYLREDDCEGVFHLRQCHPRSPFVLSNVHFLQTKHLHKLIRGLHPDRNKHLGFFEFEPITGVTLKSIVRVQWNVDLRSTMASINLKPIVLPYFWIEESFLIDDTLKFLLQADSIIFTLSSYFYAALGTFGGCCLTIGLFRWLKLYLKKRNSITALPILNNK